MMADSQINYKSFAEWWKAHGSEFLGQPQNQGFPINWESVIQLCIENDVTDESDICDVIAKIPERTTSTEIMALIRSKAKGKSE